MIPLPLDSWEIMLTYLSCHQLIIQGMNSFNTSFALHTMYTIVTLHMYIQALILQNYMYIYIQYTCIVFDCFAGLLSISAFVFRFDSVGAMFDKCS